MVRNLLMVFIGGGIGSMIRYAVQMFMHERIVAYNFPWATFTVNIVGSLLIGVFYAMSAKFNMSGELRLLLTAGLCGGFTTFSTFSNDCVEMFRQGDAIVCAIYIILSIIMGISACFAGGCIASKF